MTVSPLIPFPEPSFPTLVVGSFTFTTLCPILSAPTPQKNLLHLPRISPDLQSSALAFSINPASILIFPLAALANHLFLIFLLLPPPCFPFATHGTPPSPPLARTMSPSKLYFHIHLPPPLLPPPSAT